MAEVDRELLTLVAWDGLTPLEAGKVLGLSGSATRVRLHRLRRKLRSVTAAPDHPHFRLVPEEAPR
jgi:RNA polymerase sigma-70 factor (ECF subfamily)